MVVTEREAWDAQAATYAAAQRAVWAEDDTRYAHRVFDCLDELWPRLALTDQCGAVLDLGCGVGRLAIPVAQALPRSQIIGVDVSPRMVGYARDAARVGGVNNAGFVVGDGRTLPPLPALAGAFSVLLFQHLPGAVCAAYLAQVAAAIGSGGPVVFQYVEGVEDVAMSRQRDEVTVRSWCADAGLDVVDVSPGSVILFPEWRWVTAVKP